VVVTRGICNPWCVEVPDGTPVAFLNQDPVEYEFAAPGTSGFEIVLAPYSAAETPPLPAGTVDVSAVGQPSAAVTIIVE
jgi:hypothetical protein